MIEVKEGTTLNDRYTISEVLGSGGYGTVWKAHDKTLDRDVAIKRIHGESPNAAIEEARKTAHIHHSNIVQVFDVFEEAGDAFIVMEFVKGRSLAEILKWRSPISIAIEIGLFFEENFIGSSISKASAGAVV